MSYAQVIDLTGLELCFDFFRVPGPTDSVDLVVNKQGTGVSFGTEPAEGDSNNIVRCMETVTNKVVDLDNFQGNEFKYSIEKK